jgi:hypothetical protein
MAAGLLFLAAGPVSARPCGGDPVTVNARVNQAVELIVEDGVGDLVRSGDPATLKVEHTSGHLFVTPLTAAPAGLTVIDTAGVSHPLRFVFGPRVDERLVVSSCGRDNDALHQGDAGLALLRELLRGRVPEGAEETSSQAVMFDDGKFRLRARRLIAVPGLLGYVLDGENLSDAALAVPVTRLEYAGLLAVTSREATLEAGAVTELHMVVRR